ncbi:hypothetical protein R1flu_001241 [Riccia fluitans]|uniref:Uncharacterized protein n=1 Tax=Riccia fluitans TaxID=41844 RepID=A0ABD1Y2R1_9MARC
MGDLVGRAAVEHGGRAWRPPSRHPAGRPGKRSERAGGRSGRSGRTDGAGGQQPPLPLNALQGVLGFAKGGGANNYKRESFTLILSF